MKHNLLISVYDLNYKPLFRPKTKRIMGKQSNNSIGSFSPSFGLIGQTPSPAPVGVAAVVREVARITTAETQKITQLSMHLNSVPGVHALIGTLVMAECAGIRGGQATAV